MSIIISFVIGVLSSVVAAGVLMLRHRARYRMRFTPVFKLIEQLTDEITRDGYHYDHILAIGRNSGVAGSIMAGITGLGAVISVTMIKERLSDGSRTVGLDDVSERVFPALAGRRVLVLLCCNDSGASLRYIVDRLHDMENPPASIRTAALYTTPSPFFMPEYEAVIVGHDTKKTMSQVLEGLPWVSKRWVHPFSNERRSRSDWDHRVF